MQASRVFIVLLIFLASPDETSAKVRTYADAGEVLSLAFPGAVFREKTIRLGPDDRSVVEGIIKRNFQLKSVIFYIAEATTGEPLGYGIVVNERGKTRLITFMVIINPRGAVKSVDILVFRESQGSEVDNPRWRDQFTGKTLDDPLRLRRDIVNISGATLSSRAVTRGVKKALAVFEVVRERLKE